MGYGACPMTVTLVLPNSLAARLSQLSSSKVETGGVLLARIVASEDGDIRLLAHFLREVPDEAYTRREASSLEILSEGYVPALGEAESSGMVAIWTHTHPGNGSSPRPSIHDEKVDRQLSDLFRIRTGCSYYGALIISHQNAQMTFTGYLDDAREIRNIDRLIAIGERFSLQWNDQTTKEPIPDLFDRNIRAFGGDIQRVLGDLRIAIVGCGGTGSAIAEQLVRLGVRNLYLVDPDTLSPSNVTRVFGSGPEDVGREKVNVLGDHLARIAPEIRIKRIVSMITAETTARILAGVDLIFGCTDDNAGRLVLSRMSTYFLQPVIDCGVILTNDGEGRLDGIHGRVTILHPGAACLVCRSRVDMARAASETLTPGERFRLANEGYAPSLEGVEPAVVTFTTLVAASAVNELLERFAKYGPDPVPNEVILRVHEREISTNIQSPRERHYCHPHSGKLGLGLTSPLLEQTWMG